MKCSYVVYKYTKHENVNCHCKLGHIELLECLHYSKYHILGHEITFSTSQSYKYMNRFNNLDFNQKMIQSICLFGMVKIFCFRNC